MEQLKEDNPKGFIIIHDDSPGLIRDYIARWAVVNNTTQIVSRRDTRRWGGGPKSAASFKNNERIASGNGGKAPKPDCLIMFTDNADLSNVKLNATQKAQQKNIPVIRIPSLPALTQEKNDKSEETDHDNVIE